MPSSNQDWDQAVAKRLAQLSSMPVDASGLERRLGAQLGLRSATSPRRVATRALLAMAAAVVLGMTVWLFAVAGTSSALATPADLARLYDSTPAATQPSELLHSTAEAHHMLQSQWIDLPRLPGFPMAAACSCCLHEFKNKRVACLAVTVEDQKVTLFVAKEQDVRFDGGATVSRGGRTFCVQRSEGKSIVATQDAGRTICLVSELPPDQLLDFAAQLSY